MDGFLIFVFIVFLIVVLFRFLRKREVEAFRQADMGVFQSFNAEREKAGKDPVVVPDEALIAHATQFVKAQDDQLEVELRDGLFDEIHRCFFLELERAVEKKLRVLAHVPMTAIIRCDAQTQHRLRQKTISFVVCNPVNMNIVAGFQLKMAGSDARTDDDLKTRIFELVGVPLITFPMIAGISAAEILDQLGPILTEREIECPDCGESMELREFARGTGSGRKFKVCRRYPACKGQIFLT